MCFFESNIKALEDRGYSSLAEKIKAARELDADNVKVLESPCGCKVMALKTGKDYYIQVNSAYDPVSEAKDIISSIDFDINRSFIIVYGLGLGYHLQEIVKRINEKTLVLVVEDDINILSAAMENRDLSNEIKHENVWWIHDDNIERCRQSLSKALSFNMFNMLKIQLVTLPIVYHKYIKNIRYMLEFIDNYKNTKLFSIGNDVEDTLIGLRNNLLNIDHLITNPSIAKIKEKFGHMYKNKPAIVVASGPSLNKNIHLLKDARGKALILSCDGSVKPLIKHGIMPDAMMSVERIYKTFEAFYKDEDIPEEIVLACPPVVRNEIFEKIKSKKLSMLKKGESLNQWLNKLTGAGTVFCGASVAHAAYGLARELGCNPIILVGQDLAYSKEGFSHGNGIAVNQKVDFLNAKNIVYVKDYEGNDIPSTYVWKMFLNIFEEVISRDVDVKCIDATEGGARISGTEIMSLREAIDKYCIEDVISLREAVDSVDVSIDEILSKYVSVKKGVRNAIKRFSMLKKRCSRVIDLINDRLENFDEYLSTQEGLDRVYDVLEMVDRKVSRRILRCPLEHIFLYYTLMTVVARVNNLGSEITRQVLHDNLIIQRDFLKAAEEIAGQVVKELEVGLLHVEEKEKAHFS